MSSIMSGLIQTCFDEALGQALEEAQATPIVIGARVGHTDFATHGEKHGVLSEYKGDNAIVTSFEGENFEWPTKGMVDISRVYVLTESYIAKMQVIIDVIGALAEIGIPPSETLNSILAGTGPTPGCDCPACMRFTQEERDAAVVQYEKEVSASKAGSGNEIIDDLLATLARGAGTENGTN